MAKIYLARHQVAGLLWQHPFAQPPSDEQLAVLAKHCERLHGTEHPKTEEPYWLTVAEVDLLGPGDAPAVIAAVPSGDTKNESLLPVFGASGAGTVTPKAGS